MTLDRGRPFDPLPEPYLEYVKIWRAESTPGRPMADVWTVMVGQVRTEPPRQHQGPWLVQLIDTRWIAGKCRAYQGREQALDVARRVMADLSRRDGRRSWRLAESRRRR